MGYKKVFDEIKPFKLSIILAPNNIDISPLILRSAIPLVKKVILLLAIFVSTILRAQTFTVTGSVTDSVSTESLVGANVILENPRTEKVFGAVADQDGNFSIANVSAGMYRLRISFIGYKVLTRRIRVEGNLDLSNMKLQVDQTLLDEALVVQIQERVKQIGDTTQYNADAYKVNADASAQDLIAKMPGVVVQDGKVQAQGEEVKKVLVDGKEFFSSDPTLALQSLPAEIIDKIQVYDQKSEQSQFTGFDDGNALKTINIMTKAGKNNGQFGKVYAGYGTDDRYNAGLNFNYFKNARRISILGNFNNINQQNFSTEDIIGAIGTSSGRRGGFRGGGGTSVDDFLVGQQNGIVGTNAFGINYADEWGKKFKVSGNYFFNQTINNSQSLLNREYFSDELFNQEYSENDSTESNNLGHRINMRMEYTINDKNSLVFTPKLSFQDYESYSQLAGSTFNAGQILNSTNSIESVSRSGYNLSGELLWRHKFEKPMRTLSINLRSGLDGKDGVTNVSAENYFSANDSVWNQNQQTDLNTSGHNYSANIRYTEPVGKGMVMLDYSPGITFSSSDQNTYLLDTAQDYSILDPTLSSVFTSTYNTQQVGVGYNLRSKEQNFMLRLSYQNAILTADQQYPAEYDLSRSFNTLLPMAMYRKKISDSSNVRVFYRSAANSPSVTQLQDVIDNSNTLQLTSGNPNLNQEVRHFVVGNYSLTAPKKARTFFAFLMGEYKQNYIGNSTFTARQDTTVNGYTLAAGSQFTRPVNLDGYFSSRATLAYGFPLTGIKSNLNLNLGGAYTNAPGLIDEETNFAQTTNFNGGAVLGSNISSKVDFTMSYNGSYNLVSNTLAMASDNNYFNHTASVKFNWLIGKGLVFNTDVTNTYYAGLSNGIDQNYLLWNAYLGYKFMKNDAAELKLSVFDILGQNTNISRTITETYLEDVQTTVLQQYLMLTFTYTLRNFKAEEPSAEDKEHQRMRELLGPPPGGGRPHGE